MPRFHFLVSLEPVLEETVHPRIELSLVVVDLVQKELHGADLLSKPHQHVIPCLITSVAHGDAIRKGSHFDVLSACTEWNNMFNGHAVMSTERGVLHLNEACWTRLSHAVRSNLLEPVS